MPELPADRKADRTDYDARDAVRRIRADSDRIAAQIARWQPRPMPDGYARHERRRPDNRIRLEADGHRRVWIR